MECLLSFISFLLSLAFMYDCLSMTDICKKCVLKKNILEIQK